MVVDEERWLTNHIVTELWAGPEDDAVAKLRLPPWSQLKLRAEAPRNWRVPVRWIGSPVAAAVDGWVSAEHLGPIDRPPDFKESRGLRRRAAARWMQNHRDTDLWSGPEGGLWLVKLAKWSNLRRLGPQQGARIPVFYSGSELAPAREGWATALDLGDVGPPAEDPPRQPGWVEPPTSSGRWHLTLRATKLWSGPNNQAIGFAEIPKGSWLQQLAEQQGPRMPVYYFGNNTARPGVTWVTAADIGPVGEPPERPPKEPDWEKPPGLADRVIAYGRTLFGVPYCMGAKVPNGPSYVESCRGIDCSGFVCEVLEHCGVRLGDRNYLSAERIRQITQPINRNDARLGDLVFFERTYATSGASHIGFWIGPDRILDANSSHGVGETDVSTQWWRSRYLSMGRAF